LSKILVYDSLRNLMIIEDILKQIKEGGKILLLTEWGVPHILRSLSKNA